jgi:hypothetical protein
MQQSAQCSETNLLWCTSIDWYTTRNIGIPHGFDACNLPLQCIAASLSNSMGPNVSP